MYILHLLTAKYEAKKVLAESQDKETKAKALEILTAVNSTLAHVTKHATTAKGS